MTDQHITHVAVVGGGRWGLVICSVLQRLLPQSFPIWLVSRRLSSERVPGGVRRIFDTDELPNPEGTGAAVVATAPHDHAESAGRLLSAGWHVLVEKPLTLDLANGLTLVDQAVRLKRHLWVGLVYLFAPYLSVMKPHATGKNNWLLEWHEPEQDFRWGELKSTPHDVNLIEDIFPHAWSILRAAGLTEPLRIRSVDMVDGRGARLNLAAGESSVELLFDRHAAGRRRYLRIEIDGSRCELDFSDEPGIFKLAGTVRCGLPWNPEMRPLASELSAFLAACSGRGVPDAPVTAAQSMEAVALMEEATKTFIEREVDAIANAVCGRQSLPELGYLLFGALCREAAATGVRLSRNSDEARAISAAALALICEDDSASPGLSSELTTIVRRSTFLARVRRQRRVLLGKI
jgi:predicted dehydrogenase